MQERITGNLRFSTVTQVTKRKCFHALMNTVEYNLHVCIMHRLQQTFIAMYVHLKSPDRVPKHRWPPSTCPPSFYHWEEIPEIKRTRRLWAHIMYGQFPWCKIQRWKLRHMFTINVVTNVQYLMNAALKVSFSPNSRTRKNQSHCIKVSKPFRYYILAIIKPEHEPLLESNPWLLGEGRCRTATHSCLNMHGYF